MSSIEQYGWGAVSPRASRQVSRMLDGIEAQTAVGVARSQGRADLQSSQIDAITAVGQRGLQGVAYLSQIEGQLCQAVPHAAGRLQGIGDVTTAAIGQIVADTVTHLRRQR